MRIALALALALKNIEHQTRSINLRTGEQDEPEYRAINRQSLVPTLEIGGHAYSQSLAIIEMLDEEFPDPPLLPHSPRERAIVRAMAQIVACDIHPIGNLRVLNYLRAEFGQTQDAIDKWYQQWVALGFEALNALAEQHGNGEHCYGDTVTLADICLAPQMANARRFHCDLSPYPTLVRIDATLSKLEPFRQSAPEP